MNAPDIEHLLDILDRHEEAPVNVSANPETPETLPECPEIDPEDEISCISPDVFQGVPWDMESEVELPLDDEEMDSDFLKELESILNNNLEPEKPTIESEGIASNDKGPAHWDRCAWYHPIHYYGWDWGIFIRQDCLKRQALQIAWEFRRLNPDIIRMWSPRYLARMLYPTLLKASFFCYFLHEYYHHKVESFGFRLLVTTGAMKYLNYKTGVYRPCFGTDDCLEEAMANADIHKRLLETTYQDRLGKRVTAATRAYLKESFKTDPPGYRKAIEYLGTSRDPGERRLQSQIFEASLKPGKRYDDWLSAPVMMKGFFNLKSNIFEIVPTGGKPILPGAPFFTKFTISSAQLIKVAIKKKGYKIVPGGKGSHVKLKKPDHRTLIVPGNRKDLSHVAERLLKDLGYGVNDISELNKL
jgi:predicted RNA binding protein YcfA (HicA-like mRNA interferase family)